MNYEKVSPMLAAVLADFERTGRPGLRPHVSNLGLVSTEPTARPARVVVFLHVDAQADLEDLSEYGVEVNAGEGPIRTGIVPLDGIERLSEDPAVTRIVPARRLRPLLDVAVPAVGVPAMRKRGRLSGKGVVIGTVDTGIQASHPSFKGRVARIWDQTMAGGKGVAEGRYGVELSGAMCDLSKDTIGHGTHVAGIAAGADRTYTGVAPRAQLVIVKSDLLTAHIADGIRYIFRVASQLGCPAVVNLSLGGHDDAHDGTDSLSAVIDASVGPGRIVCCAAGNEGNDNIHAQVLAHQGVTRTIACAIDSPGPGELPIVANVNGWYSGADRIDVAVVGPSGTQTPFQPIISKGSPVRDYSLTDGVVRITSPGPDPANGDHNFIVQIQPAPAPLSPPPSPVPGGWRIRLNGVKVVHGRVDVWVIDDVALFTGRAVQDSMKVGSPGAATRAITLASYTTRVAWKDPAGKDHLLGLELYDISDFSSEGPGRDGAQKPDLAAPGAAHRAAADRIGHLSQWRAAAHLRHRRNAHIRPNWLAGADERMRPTRQKLRARR
ncbi:MAG: S8 family serine peptidase [Acidimicrobiales bacterium]